MANFLKDSGRQSLLLGVIGRFNLIGNRQRTAALEQPVTIRGFRHTSTFSSLGQARSVF